MNTTPLLSLHLSLIRSFHRIYSSVSFFFGKVIKIIERAKLSHMASTTSQKLANTNNICRDSSTYNISN